MSADGLIKDFRANETFCAKCYVMLGYGKKIYDERKYETIGDKSLLIAECRDRIIKIFRTCEAVKHTRRTSHTRCLLCWVCNKFVKSWERSQEID